MANLVPLLPYPGSLPWPSRVSLPRLGVHELSGVSRNLASDTKYSDFLTYLNYGADGLAIAFGLVATLTRFGILGGPDHPPKERPPKEEVPAEGEVIALI